VRRPPNRRPVSGVLTTETDQGVPHGHSSVATVRGRGAERDAVATGTVVVDGETLVDGTTANAEIEILEDRNVTTGAG
jgi:hypothetical protein